MKNKAEKSLMKISENIKKYRLLNNMTQQELAAELELNPQYYAQLERCRNGRQFSLPLVIRLAEIFNVGIEDIIELEYNYDADEKSKEKAESIKSRIDGLTSSQLAAVDKFMTDIIPLIK